ncbi:hypothetical protein [Maribacter aestuarii]|uniref:hypothetical protein n=1 Tax=Maribacter aestuarii TaxID=1130723 RepID=UPI00248CC52D|nr:hypothetical protein [Maribacter aestuarii]
MNFFKNFFKTNTSRTLFNLSDREIKDLLCGFGKSEIKNNEIFITDYPFQPSVAYPEIKILAKDIQYISTDFGICRIYIQNDIVFVTSVQKGEILAFAKEHKIQLIKHSFNWDWILEPYLDTEFTPENEKLVSERLLEVGIDALETEEIRLEVGRQMIKYNFETMLWDWCSLGLYDVLCAMRAKYSPKEFEKFYKRAIEIDKRVKITR